MANDKKHSRRVTLADLCQAIEEQRISYTRRDEYYEVSGGEMRRLERAGSTAEPDVMMPLETPIPEIESSL